MCAMALVHARAGRVVVGRGAGGGAGVLTGDPGALPGAGAGVRDRAGRRRGPGPRLHGLAGLNHRYEVWLEEGGGGEAAAAAAGEEEETEEGAADAGGGGESGQARPPTPLPTAPPV